MGVGFIFGTYVGSGARSDVGPGVHYCVCSSVCLWFGAGCCVISGDYLGPSVGTVVGMGALLDIQHGVGCNVDHPVGSGVGAVVRPDVSLGGCFNLNSDVERDVAFSLGLGVGASIGQYIGSGVVWSVTPGIGFGVHW